MATGSTGDTSEVVINVVVDDGDAAPKLKSLSTQLSGLSTKLKVLSADSGTGTSALSRFKSGISDLNDKTKTLNETLGKLSEAVGDRLKEASKKGLEGIVALGVGAATVMQDVSNQIQSATFTIGQFAPKSVTQGLISQMRSYTDIVGLNQQAQDAKQLVVTPQYTGSALALMQANQRIAATAGANAGSVLSQLTSLEGRAESTGKVAPRAFYQLGESGVPVTEIEQMLGYPTTGGPQSAEQNLSQLANTLGPARFNQLMMEIGDKFANAPTQYREQTLQGAEGNIKRIIEDSFAGVTGNAGGLGSEMLKTIGGPLTNSIQKLMNTIAPPLMKFVNALLVALTALLPVLAPVIAMLGNGLAKVLKTLTPVLKDLQPLGASLSKSLGQAVNALLPVIPVFAQAVMQIAPVLPDFITMLSEAIRLFAFLARMGLDAFNLFAKLPVVGTVFKGLLQVIAGLVLLKLVSGQLIESLKKLAQWFKNVFNEWFKKGKKESPSPEGGDDNCSCGGTGMPDECTNICEGAELGVKDAMGNNFSSTQSLPGNFARAFKQIVGHPLQTAKSAADDLPKMIEALGKSIGTGILGFLGITAAVKLGKSLKGKSKGGGSSDTDGGSPLADILPFRPSVKGVEGVADDIGKATKSAFSAIGGFFGNVGDDLGMDALNSLGAKKLKLSKQGGLAAGGLAAILGLLGIAGAGGAAVAGPAPTTSAPGLHTATLSSDITSSGNIYVTINVAKVDSDVDMEKSVTKALEKIAKTKARRQAASPAGKAANSSQFWLSNGWLA